MAEGNTLSHLHLIRGGVVHRQAIRSSSSTEPETYLRPVVEAAAQESAGVTIRRLECEAQGWLFPDPALLGLVYVTWNGAAALAGLLQLMRPRWLMDLRAAPVFDDGWMTRKWFLRLFEQLGIIYRDVPFMIHRHRKYEASLSSGAMVEVINELIASQQHVGVAGPIFFLLNRTEQVPVAERILPLLLRPRPEHGWIVATWEARRQW